MGKSDTIHVAYGFHVNLYHSYRGDSNDGLGFGSDIRIIRKIIDSLNRLNGEGIPVKGTWDCENFFSLEKILPEYAPDIISGIRERVEKHGDENIIMGYSNGALSAMNDDEFSASLALAASNKNGSGLEDIFGTYEPIVRPQEVMFTPSQAGLYNKCGIKAVCLYYSCIPFDAFRTIVPRLSDEEALNPLTYSYKGERITVIPTYSNADVCDAGCLRAWVKALRKKQESGEINSDLFIFINMDADAIFWESLDLPVIKNRLANTDGIHGLVTEISDLDYIVFDTPGGYLKEHEPKGKIEFTHDTADGNFTGYSSWAEKPYNRKIWTAVERSRAMSKAGGSEDKSSASFTDRLLLLSTTHFGLATPVLNIAREQKADALAKKIIESELKAQKTVDGLTVKNLSGGRFQSVQLEIKDKINSDETTALISDDIEAYAVIKAENSTVFALIKFKEVKEEYILKAVKVKAENPEDNSLCLKTKTLEIEFSGLRIKSVKYKGRKIGGDNFLQSYITYGKKRYDFKVCGVKAVSVCGSGKCVRIHGEIHLPNEITGGKFRYDFLTVPFSDAVFIKSEITYPHTPEKDSISTENSSLGRYTDNGWVECVPFQLTPDYGNDLSVVKRNFSGDVSSFRVNAFTECDEKNKALDSFNHQLTGGFTGLAGGSSGLAFAVSRQVLNSMACCPMRLYNGGTVSMNPFGTYYGRQRHHFSLSKNEIQNAYSLIAAQSKSLAPSYNGVSETAFNALFGFDGEMPDGEILENINAFSDGCVALADKNSILQPFYGDNITAAAPVSTAENVKLKSPVLYGIKGNLGKYIVYGAKALGHIIISQIKSR
ncbi:MAG: hypothetical protein MJ177_03365 [Clostridia bacterium]|nr:hypothetical protein [Clostridia bacterium]